MKKNIKDLLNIVIRRDLIRNGKIKIGDEVGEWIITSIIVIVVSSIIMLFDDTKSVKDYLESIGGYITLFILAVKILLNILRSNRFLFESRVNEVKNEVTNYLSNSRIVFESSIKDFDNKHLESLNQILQSLNSKEVKDIICLDNSDPHQWWSDSMTGYMALLSNWKSFYSFVDTEQTDNNGKVSTSRVQHREVSRIFVFTREELHSPVTLKTLAYHSMLGFRTYVYLKDMYERVLNDFIIADKKRREGVLQKKEFFIWNNSDTHKAKCNVNHYWESICCYLSFWDIDFSKKKRDNAIRAGKEYKEWKSYYGGKPEHEIDVYFEFIPTSSLSKQTDKRWKLLPQLYYELGIQLIDKTTCIDSFTTAIRKYETEFFPGIEIKSRSCNLCTKLQKCKENFKENGSDFAIIANSNIREIINTYIDKVDYEIQKA